MVARRATKQGQVDDTIVDAAAQGSLLHLGLRETCMLASLAWMQSQARWLEAPIDLRCLGGTPRITQNCYQEK